MNVYEPAKELPLADLRLSARIPSRLEAARLFGVTLPTWKRWEDHEAAPPAVRIALQLLAGHLPHVEWKGWGFSAKDGLLWSPEGQGYHPGDLRSVHYLRAAVRDLLSDRNHNVEPVDTPNYLDNVIPFKASRHNT